MIFSFLPWLHWPLSCSVLLLMRRLHLFILRMFVTCEDFRLKFAPNIIFHVLKEFTLDSWEAVLHLSTSPAPQVEPRLVAQGLGAVDNYEISDALWNDVVLVGFETSVSEFSLSCDVYSPTREEMVLPMDRWLLTVGVVNILDRGCHLRDMLAGHDTQDHRKVSLIFNLVDLLDGLQKPASFSLDGWEQISQKFAQWPADRPLFCTHVNLKNAFWSFTMPQQHARAFRFFLQWEGEDRILCMSWMPFGWKHSPLFC